MATSDSVSEPSVVIVVAVPLPLVMVKLPAGTAVELPANVPDVHEAVVAVLFTMTSWFPAELPEAAEAVTTFELEEVAVIAESGPVILLKLCISLSRLDASV